MVSLIIIHLQGIPRWSFTDIDRCGPLLNLWDYNACSTELTSSSRTSAGRGQLQQGASQQTTSRVCKPGSAPSHASWTAVMGFLPASDHLQHSALLFAQRWQAGKTNPSHREASKKKGTHFTPRLRCRRHVLLFLSVADGRTKIRRNIASTAGTSDTAGHEGPREVRQWRILPLSRRTCASSLRLACVANV